MRNDKCWVQIDPQKSEHFWLIFCSLIYSFPAPDTRKYQPKSEKGAAAEPFDARTLAWAAVRVADIHKDPADERPGLRPDGNLSSSDEGGDEHGHSLLALLGRANSHG